MSSGYTATNRYQDSVRAKGRLFIGAVISKEGAGGVLVDVAIRPTDFPNSLLGRRASTWERYLAKSAVIKFSPSIPTSINSNLITYFEQDVTDIAQDGVGALNIALAHNHSVQHAANMPRTIKCTPPKETLWTSKGTTDRLDSMGRVVVVQRQAPVNFSGEVLPAGTPLGDLTLEWDVEFSIANLEQTVAAEQPPVLDTDLIATTSNGPNFILGEGEFAYVSEASLVANQACSIVDADLNTIWEVNNVLQIVSQLTSGPGVYTLTADGNISNYIITLLKKPVTRASDEVDAFLDFSLSLDTSRVRNPRPRRESKW